MAEPSLRTQDQNLGIGIACRSSAIAGQCAYKPHSSVAREGVGELFARNDQEMTRFFCDFLWFVGKRRLDVVAFIPDWSHFRSTDPLVPRWSALLAHHVTLGGQVRVLVQDRSTPLIPADQETNPSSAGSDLVFGEEATLEKPLLHIRRAKQEESRETFIFWLGHGKSSAEACNGPWALWTPSLKPRPEAKVGSISSMLSINGKSATELGPKLLEAFNRTFRNATEAGTECVTLVPAIESWPS